MDPNQMNLLSRRKPFENQIAQCLFVELSEIDVQFIDYLIQDLHYVLKLSQNLKENNRIPGFRLSTIGNEHILRNMSTDIRNEPETFFAQLKELKTFHKESKDLGTSEDVEKSLDEAMKTSIKYFETNLKNPKMDVTVITKRNRHAVLRMLEHIIENLESNWIHEITVFEFRAPEDVQNALPDMNTIKGAIVKTRCQYLTWREDFQNHLKSWLMEKDERASLLIHFRRSNTTLMCKIDRRILSTWSLPLGSRFHLQTESTEIAVSQNSKQYVDIYQLDVMYKVRLSEVKDENTFGDPIYVWPTNQSGLAQPEQDYNLEKFGLLCKNLRTKQECLLAKYRSNTKSDKFLPCFVLFPRDRYFILKSFVTNDIKLPLPELDYEVLEDVQLYSQMKTLVNNLEDVSEKFLDSGLSNTFYEKHH